MTSLDSLTSSVTPSYTEQAASPFLASYQGMSSNQLETLASEQASYHPQAPAANAQAASDLISQAMTTAQDPALQTALLQKAYQLITPGGASSPSAVAGQPSAGNAASGNTIASIEQQLQALTQELAALTGQAQQPGPAAAPGGVVTTAPGATPTAGTSNIGMFPQNGLSVSGNTVDTGRYTIAASKSDDGSLTVTDKQTGKSFEVWGDPHIKENGQDVADFQKDNLNIQLQDGTTIHMQPSTLQNGVAHLDQVSITKGDQAVTMGGTNGNFNQGVTTSAVMNGQAANQSALYNAPNSDNITFGADDMLHYNNANGSMGGVITAQANGGETNLDGVGGGLVGQPGTSATYGTGSAPSNDQQQLINQLMQSVQAYVGGFQGSIIQNMLNQMRNHSGFESA